MIIVMPALLELLDHLEDLLDHDRREPERELVEQQDPRLEQQALGDGQHLLLAAGERPGGLVEPLAQPGEQLEHLVDAAPAPRRVSRCGGSPGQQVLGDGQGRGRPPCRRGPGRCRRRPASRRRRR
jgi:hypothetical protein